MIIPIILLILFIVIGIMLSLGKWSFLIAGFNTMTKEEKENYDVLALCKFMGKFMFIIAFCILLFILSDILMIKELVSISTTIIYVSVIFLLIYTNTGNRFLRNKK